MNTFSSGTITFEANDHVSVVNRKHLVGVDSDAEETGVGVDHEAFVSLVQVVDDSSFGQVGHVGQILEKLILRRVLLFNLGIEVE